MNVKLLFTSVLFKEQFEQFNCSDILYIVQICDKNAFSFDFFLLNETIYTNLSI